MVFTMNVQDQLYSHVIEKASNEVTAAFACHRPAFHLQHFDALRVAGHTVSNATSLL